MRPWHSISEGCCGFRKISSLLLEVRYSGCIRLPVCGRACVRACVHACARARVRVRARVCVCVCVRVCSESAGNLNVFFCSSSFFPLRPWCQTGTQIANDLTLPLAKQALSFPNRNLPFDQNCYLLTPAIANHCAIVNVPRIINSPRRSHYSTAGSFG